ncbi:MAG: hypothetical protein A2X13_14750 [Bacteroidetes bacterium GWC2_33_15]|nr:MAG: hypothetical protein A2X10_06815 [Bacteroidetes bacterium GWA2_33_15]OFX50132.1 MAG: hypothetical protein A2X13_14750 [Bacteroidetes bacterium GWC2_33_15]OFX65285.1 MAG: hypothetical protein A2X15_04325 [Bacteroidetes bacterium GWB2_32_14]OFX70511.1 MAG: hypothetical protein A2X14_04380 [Bacteroidetes bacterium GWD2_33_33]HAN19616.1 hypothetical protein [Bacteroidales bacterium]
MRAFGKTSNDRLNTANSDIQLVMRKSVATCPVDFGIAQGGRTYEQQLEYFLKGASSLDPRDLKQKEKAKHLHTPSDAVDIYIYIPERNDMMYDKEHLAFVAGWILCTADRLFREGKIKRKLRWGGNWDGDGILIIDQQLQDRPHFETI